MNDMTIESNFKDAPYAEWLAEGVVVPDQLVVLPSGRLKRRRDLYAHDQAALAAAARRAEYALAARYEGALAEPFLRWTEARLREGAIQKDLTQETFWREQGHVPVA